MALTFNGSASKVLMTDSADWDMGGGDFTFTWWEYRTSSANLKTPFAREEVNIFCAYLVGYNSSGTIRFYSSSNNSTPWDIVSGLSMGSVTTNTWTHYALTRSGSTFTPYKDGVAGSTASSATAMTDVAVPLAIGHVQNTHWFQGYIENLQFYKGKALSLEEIQSIYYGRGMDINVSSEVLRLPFNERVEGTTLSATGQIHDLSASANTASAIGTGGTFTAGDFMLP